MARRTSFPVARKVGLTGTLKAGEGLKESQVAVATRPRVRVTGKTLEGLIGPITLTPVGLGTPTL